jgi:hypothetical protein
LTPSAAAIGADPQTRKAAHGKDQANDRSSQYQQSHPNPGLAASEHVGHYHRHAPDRPEGLSAACPADAAGCAERLSNGLGADHAVWNAHPGKQVSDLQAILQAYQAIDAQALALKQAHQQVQTQLASWKAEFQNIKTAILAYFGLSSPQLTQFGLKPKATKVLTTQEKAERDAKSVQTRAIRGTASNKRSGSR